MLKHKRLPGCLVPAAPAEMRFHLPPCLLCRNWLPRYPQHAQPTNFSEGSPLAAIENSFARVSGPMPQQRMSRHPFLPDADDFPHTLQGLLRPDGFAAATGRTIWSGFVQQTFEVSSQQTPTIQQRKDRIAAELRKILRIAAVKSIDHGRRDLKKHCGSGCDCDQL